MRSRTKLYAFLTALAAALLASACIPGGGESDETIPEYATTTTTAEEEQTAAAPQWRCGEVKEALYRSVAILSSFAGDLEAPPAVPTAADLWTGEDLRAALRAAANGFTASDQAALNAACELYGQHDAALELWSQADRGDACDVWRPAHASAGRVSFDVGSLHPLSSQMWISATGAVSEGHGRCIAERAN